MVAGGDPLYVKFWGKLTTLKGNRRFSVDIVRNASAVTHSKKVQLTPIGSPLRAFQ